MGGKVTSSPPRGDRVLPAWPSDPRGTPADPGGGPRHSDVAVIGAGPAGMSAAVVAAQAGCGVTVLDLGERPGGQYWRWGPASDDGRFHHRWPALPAPRDPFAPPQAAGRIAHLPRHAGFYLDPPSPAPASTAPPSPAPASPGPAPRRPP